MIEPLLPKKNVVNDNARAWGTPTPTPDPTPAPLCAFCACSWFFGDAAQNQFAIQVNNGG
ncbi:MAG: hypothetical protein ACOZEN_11085 [Thermodesulfobacteriota bacterium]